MKYYRRITSKWRWDIISVWKYDMEEVVDGEKLKVVQPKKTIPTFFLLLQNRRNILYFECGIKYKVNVSSCCTSHPDSLNTWEHFIIVVIFFNLSYNVFCGRFFLLLGLFCNCVYLNSCKRILSILAVSYLCNHFYTKVLHHKKYCLFIILCFSSLRHFIFWFENVIFFVLYSFPNKILCFLSFTSDIMQINWFLKSRTATMFKIARISQSKVI